jgi:hypothetical protein
MNANKKVFDIHEKAIEAVQELKYTEFLFIWVPLSHIYLPVSDKFIRETKIFKTEEMKIC